MHKHLVGRNLINHNTIFFLFFFILSKLNLNFVETQYLAHLGHQKHTRICMGRSHIRLRVTPKTLEMVLNAPQPVLVIMSLSCLYLIQWISRQRRYNSKSWLSDIKGYSEDRLVLEFAPYASLESFFCTGGRNILFHQRYIQRVLEF